MAEALKTLELKAPDVTVAPPEVHVAAPEVTVAPAAVHVDAPDLAGLGEKIVSGFEQAIERLPAPVVLVEAAHAPKGARAEILERNAAGLPTLLQRTDGTQARLEYDGAGNLTAVEAVEP